MEHAYLSEVFPNIQSQQLKPRSKPKTNPNTNLPRYTKIRYDLELQPYQKFSSGFDKILIVHIIIQIHIQMHR